MPVGSYRVTTALSHYLGHTTRNASVMPTTRDKGMMGKLSVDVQDLADLRSRFRMGEWCYRREMSIASHLQVEPSSSSEHESSLYSSLQGATSETSPSLVCHYQGKGGCDDTRSRNEWFDQKEQGTTALELSVNQTMAGEWTEVTS